VNEYLWQVVLGHIDTKLKLSTSDHNLFPWHVFAALQNSVLMPQYFTNIFQLSITYEKVCVVYIDYDIISIAGQMGSCRHSYNLQQ
jgi:hypothetical protein